MVRLFTTSATCLLACLVTLRVTATQLTHIVVERNLPRRSQHNFSPG